MAIVINETALAIMNALTKITNMTIIMTIVPTMTAMIPFLGGDGRRAQPRVGHRQPHGRHLRLHRTLRFQARQQVRCLPTLSALSPCPVVTSSPVLCQRISECPFEASVPPRWGTRQVCALGALISCLGLALGSFAKSLAHVMVAYRCRLQWCHQTIISQHQTTLE